MPNILTTEQMQALETAADSAGYSYDKMMERAGRATAEFVKNLIRAKSLTAPRIAVLVGKGNNGGDGLIAARFLKEKTDAQLTVYLTEALDDDAKVNALRELGVLVADAPTDSEQGYRVLKTMAANADIIVDAILGTGARLPIRGDLEKILRQVQHGLKERAGDRPPVAYTALAGDLQHTYRFGDPYAAPIIVAIDLPTGLDADTGELDPNALHADYTLTFEAVKPGMLKFPGADAVGHLTLANLGLPDKVRTVGKLTLVDAATVKPLLPTRSNDSNKGSHGKALIAAGSINYSGAPALAAEAAYRVGTGLVTVAAPQPIIGMIGAHLREATWLVMPHDMGVFNRGAARALREGLDGYTALLIGPGLGQEEPTADFLNAFLTAETAKSKARTGFGFAPAVVIEEAKKDGKDNDNKPLPPLVIDADALNLLAKTENWASRLPPRSILTPHPGEMARLCGFTDDADGKATDKVQADRVKLATEKAAEWTQVIVLKGAFTVIADPDGRTAVLPFANSALSKAGTGDVLAGMIVGLLAQGLDPFDAAVAGAYLHGLSAAIWTTTNNGSTLLAHQVTDGIGRALSDVLGTDA